jgi:hypothetical protein
MYLETKLKKETERLVNLEFERLYGEVKQKKNSNKPKFHELDTKIAKKYKEVCNKFEKGLLRLFEGLKVETVSNYFSIFN